MCPVFIISFPRFFVYRHRERERERRGRGGGGLTDGYTRAYTHTDIHIGG